jgi:hypothetical protein
MNSQAVSHAKFERIHSVIANMFFQHNYDAMVIKQIVLAESRATERYTNGVTKVKGRLTGVPPKISGAGREKHDLCRITWLQP